MKIWISLVLFFIAVSSGPSSTSIPVIEPRIIKHYQTYSIPEKYHYIVINSASKNGIPIWLFSRLIEKESSWNPKAYRKNKNGSKDIGIAQFNNKYIADYIWFDNDGKKFDPWNAFESIPVMARYLKRLYDATSDWSLAVLAYNAGLSRVLENKVPKSSMEHMEIIMKIY